MFEVCRLKMYMYDQNYPVFVQKPGIKEQNLF